MSSNSPVLLLAPSAVPTAPIMAPLLVAKSADLRARGLMPSTFPSEKLGEAPPSAAVGKAVASPRVETPATPAAPPPSPVVAAAKPASPKVASPVVVPVISPVAQVANAAPIVSARPTVPTPTAPTPVVAPVQVASPEVATSPVRPSVAAPAMTTRATPVVTPTTTTTTTTPTTKRATAVAASTSTALTIAAPSPAASPKSAPSSPSSPKTVTKSSTGRWTEAEHKLFLKGLEQFPYRAWKKIATLIKTRTVVQIRTHAQKYYQKLEKEEQRMREREAQLAAQQQQQQGAATSVAALAASAVTTPRSAVPTTPTTPAAAASASFRELSLSAPLVTTPSAAAAAAPQFAVGREDADATAGFMGAAGKRKAPMRKRKSSADETSDAPSSLPKRMMKEKKFVREKTMSPKQKTVVSNGRAFGFGDADVSSGDDCAKGSSVRGLSGLKTHPLDFDDDDDDVAASSTSMILDFAEEKPIEYPFTLDTALERGLAAIDHNELLQLSDDDEGMEWFASASAGEDVDLLDTSVTEESDAAAIDGAALNLDGNVFSPLYSESALHFVDPSPAASECSTPSPILSSSANCSDFELSGDEADDDEDFVLDPEKFLSSYFSPRAHKDEDMTEL